MPARVEYVTAGDGVRIAYSRRGRGLPVLWMPPLPARHLELEWQQPGDRLTDTGVLDAKDRHLLQIRFGRRR